MPLSEEQKSAIVERAVAILRAPDREAQMEALRQKVMAERPGSAEESPFDPDDALYSVLQALEELYG